MSANEFSRPLRLDAIGAQERAMTIAADEAERTALARRFGLTRLDRLEAELSVRLTEDDILAQGTLHAVLEQACVATGAPVPATIEEPFAVRFRPGPAGGSEDEIELSDAELDTHFFEGGAIDVGEAVAQTLALALDPYPRAAGSDAALREAGVKNEGEAGPFGALAGLRDALDRK